MNEEIQIIYNSLFLKYNKLSLSLGETAKVLGIARSTLDAHIADGIPAPKFKSDGPNKPKKFPILEIAKFMVITRG